MTASSGAQVSAQTALERDGWWRSAAENEASRGGDATSWMRTLQRGIWLTDALVIGVSLFAAYSARFSHSHGHGPTSTTQLANVLSALVIGATWLVLLRHYRTSEVRRLGIGSEEFTSLANATLRVFGLVAIAAYAFRLPVARGFLLIALPAGLIGLVASRCLWRSVLHRRRDAGQCLRSVLIVGSPDSVAPLAARIAGTPRAGYRVAGVCLPDAGSRLGGDVAGTRVFGTVNQAVEIAVREGVDAVALTTTDAASPAQKQDLAWALDERGIEFIVAPSLVNVAGPRLTTRPVAGMPLLHVAAPANGAFKRRLKRTFDLVFAVTALIVALPLMALIALAIRLDSPGPVLYRQVRLGVDGRRFTLVKFRTMQQDADQLLESLATSNEGAGPLFKIRRDPRITHVGRVLRAHSLDELPQLFNVLTGAMSVVGPRPPLPREARRYGKTAQRRLLVKPGITGPWQVGGRSDLSWEDSVRLDLYYVDNWTLSGDLAICARTLGVMIKGTGAY